MPTISLISLRWFAVVAIVLGFYAQLDAAPLFDLDEGAFSEATREMFARGDFLSTFLNGQPRYDKPILIYWLQAASVWWLGLNEVALRLPSAIAATLWLAVVYGWIKRARDETTALYAVIMMAASLEIPIMAKAATADALLNLWITGAMAAIHLYYTEKRRIFYYLAFAAMGLGVLTKGPIAVVVPGVVSLLFYFLKNERQRWLRTVVDPRGWLLLVLIAGPWYFAQYVLDTGFLSGFFFKHNVGRFQSAMEGHSGSLFYYLPVIVLGVLPYTGLLIVAGVRMRAWLRHDLFLYLLIWFTVILVLFTFSSTKLPHYIVYGYVPLFVAMAAMLKEAHGKFWLLVPPLLFFALLLLIPWLIQVSLPTVQDEFARIVLSESARYFDATYRLTIGIAFVLTLFMALMPRVAPPWPVLGVGLITVWLMSHLILPLVGQLQQQPIKEAALLARALPQPVVMWKLNTPSFMVYSERLVEQRPPRRGDVVLTKVNYLPRLPQYDLLYGKHGIVLVKLRE